MKKNIAFLLALTIVGSCATPLSQTGMLNMTSIEASAATNYNGFEYTVSSNNVTITNYTGTSKNVTIPENINGKKVTAIGSWAFSSKAIESVVIPNTVVSLGDYSFYNCQNLKTVTLSNQLVSSKSGGYLFYQSPVTTIHISETMKEASFIDHFNYHTDAVVNGTSGYLKYSMPIKTKEVTITGYLGNGGEVEIPDYILGQKVTTISSSAFKGNNTITSFKFGNSVTTIESYAFNNCTSLKTMTLGANLSTELSGGYLFNGCNDLKTINVPYEMKDTDFVFHFRYLSCFSELMRTVIDKRVETVYNELKESNPSIQWNIRGLQGNEREKAKYEVAKYIHSKLGNNANDTSVYIRYISSAEENTPYSLVTGEGTCAGMSSSYALLLYKAGFTLDEIDIIGAPSHQLAGVKLFNQWYLVECTNNAPSSFGMHFNSDNWYKEGTYNGVKKVSSDADLYLALDQMYTKNGTTTQLNEATQAYLNSKYGLANGGVNPSVSEYSRGDIDMNGIINSFDLVLLKRYLNTNNTSNINLVNCDINHDGNINSSDVRLLQDYLLGKIDQF